MNPKTENEMDKVLTYLVVTALIMVLLPFVLAGCVLAAVGGAVKAAGLLLTFDTCASMDELRDIRRILWSNFTMEDRL